MDEIISTLVESLTSMVTGSATAIGDGITNLLFVTATDGGAITGLSNAGIFIVTMLGIGFAVGLMRVIFGLVRARG